MTITAEIMDMVDMAVSGLRRRPPPEEWESELPIRDRTGQRIKDVPLTDAELVGFERAIAELTQLVAEHTQCSVESQRIADTTRNVFRTTLCRHSAKMFSEHAAALNYAAGQLSRFVQARQTHDAPHR